MITGNNGKLFARYGVEKGRITNSRVKPKLFEPRKDGTLSVHLIDMLSRSEVIAIGECIAKKRKKTLYGWGEITRLFVEEIKLTLYVDNDPCPGHAIIGGWPKERNAIRDKQKELAENSCGILL